MLWVHGPRGDRNRLPLSCFALQTAISAMFLPMMTAMFIAFAMRFNASSERMPFSNAPPSLPTSMGLPSEISRSTISSCCSTSVGVAGLEPEMRVFGAYCRFGLSTSRTACPIGLSRTSLLVADGGKERG